MDDNTALLIENAQLKVEVKMLNMMLEQANMFNSKTDENLKLSIQAPSARGSRSPLPEGKLEKKLLPTVNLNLADIDSTRLIVLLESDTPAVAALVEIFDKAMRGPHSDGQQLVKYTTKQFCKHIDTDGNEVVLPINVVFDDICAEIYQHCSKVASHMLSEDPETMDEASYQRSSNRYNNTMAFQDPKEKKRLLKEIATMFV